MDEKKWHFIGIGGIGMSGLARILLQENVAVSGSDLHPKALTKRLEKEGAAIHYSHEATRVQSGMEIVYGSMIGHNNPEIEEAKRLQCRLWHRADLLAHLQERYASLCVAGSHGKTSTSALLTHVLIETGRDPSYALGGILIREGVNGAKGQGRYFVCEADESDGTLTKYHPYGAIVTNIGRDHLAHYGEIAAIHETFRTFIHQVQSLDAFVWCGDDPTLWEWGLQGIHYGFHSRCTVQVVDFVQKGWEITFSLRWGSKQIQAITLPCIGRHQALNATAVFILATQLGIQEDEVRSAFRSYRGVERRAERVGTVHDVTVIDDYAHYPVEINAVLRAIRKASPYQRVVAICQPHRFSRVRDSLGEWGRAFDAADECRIVDVYAAGEEPLPGITAERIVQEIQNQSTLPCEYVSRESLLDHVQEITERYDIVVFLGAGDISAVAHAYAASLVDWSPRKTTVGILCGGRSVEHAISLRSAHFVQEALSKEHYAVQLFTIDREGGWHDEEGSDNDIWKRVEKCDVFIPVLHGPFGEDGTMQGFLEILGKPYVGSPTDASAIAMNKMVTKEVAQYLGIATLPFLSTTYEEWLNKGEEFLDRVQQNLSFPLFVKANRLGSSLGIAKVTREEDLIEAIESVFQYDHQIFLEQGISARELEFAILGDEDPEVFPPGEVLTGGDFYDYDAKYGKESFATEVVASLPEKVISLGKKWTKELFIHLGCSGLARVDFFYEEDRQQLWFSEINPIPGLTKTSLCPQILGRQGISPSRLVDILMQCAQKKARRQKRTFLRTCSKFF